MPHPRRGTTYPKMNEVRRTDRVETPSTHILSIHSQTYLVGRTLHAWGSRSTGRSGLGASHPDAVFVKMHTRLMAAGMHRRTTWAVIVF